jgi:hypothetical protein
MRLAWRSGILAPLVVATFPVVYLWGSNVRNQILPADVLGVLIAVWAATLACFAVCLLVYRDASRASVATTILAVLVLSFGHVTRGAEAEPEGRQMTLLLVAFLLLAISALVVATRARIPQKLLPSVTFVAGGLVVLNLFTIAVSGTAVTAGGLSEAGDHVVVEGIRQPAGGGRDVYYLVFDRYANERVLELRYGFDNTDFLDGLESRGFIVNHDAVANYPGTAHSLASTLNLTYLDDLGASVGRDSDDWRPLYASLTDSVAKRAFDRIGYRTVHIGSWWGPTFQDPSADVSYVYRELREFPAAFLFTTAIPYVSDALGIADIPEKRVDQFHRVPFQARAIREVSSDPRPTFTFAHLTLPHDPYVFDRNGDFVPDEGSRPVEEAYLEQLRYTNALIEDLVDDLLEGPDRTDPIVILQSDEGPHPIAMDDLLDPRFTWPEQPHVEVERKMKILSAYYLPGSDGRGPLPTQTPVNTFRAIFDRYFGAHLSLLPDRAFVYERGDRPYRFRDYSDRLGIANA